MDSVNKQMHLPGIKVESADNASQSFNRKETETAASTTTGLGFLASQVVAFPVMAQYPCVM